MVTMILSFNMLLSIFVFYLVFGVDLTTLVKLEGKVVPNILNVCVTEIESRENGKCNNSYYDLLLFLEILSLHVLFKQSVCLDYYSYSVETANLRHMSYR